MPIHDWTRVGDAIFHAFHCAWVPRIGEALNAGILPPDYYALPEQIAGPLGPDVLTLQTTGGNGTTYERPQGASAVTLAPPRVRFTSTAEADEYALKQRNVVVRHSSEDRVVALIEIVSRGNKGSRHALRSFLAKATAALARGIHLLVIDLHPPGPRDPQGMHGALWAEVCDEPYVAPPDQPLTLAAYAAGRPITAYVEPVAVGQVLPDMPLFLDPTWYVNVPLETTYQPAAQGLPLRWRGVLEGPGA